MSSANEQQQKHKLGVELARSLLRRAEFFHDDRGALIAQDERHIVTFSKAGALRGMHFQKTPQEKVVMCIAGRILDVIVDCRPGAPTFGFSAGFYLDGALSQDPNGKRGDLLSVRVPAGFAHGYLALTDSIVQYRLSADYDEAQQGGFAWSSAPCVKTFSSALTAFRQGEPPILSTKDREAPVLLSMGPDDFPFFANLG